MEAKRCSGCDATVICKSRMTRRYIVTLMSNLDAIEPIVHRLLLNCSLQDQISINNCNKTYLKHNEGASSYADMLQRDSSTTSPKHINLFGESNQKTRFITIQTERCSLLWHACRQHNEMYP